MLRMAFCSVMVLLLSGCGNSQQAELSKDPGIPTWDGLKVMTGQDVLMPMVMGAQRDIAALKTHVQTPKFQEALTKFEQEPIPAKYATPEREAARTEAIKHFKELIEGAKSGAPDAKLKESALAAHKAVLAVAAKPETPPK